MAKPPSKKAPGSLRMAISGTAAEMAKIKAVAAARKMQVTRLIHDAVTYYDENKPTDSAPDSAPFDVLSPDPFDEIKALLYKVIDNQNQKGGGTKATAKGLDGVPKQLDELHKILKSLSQAVKRELPRRGNLLDQSIYSIPALEAVQIVTALVHNILETGKFEVDIGQAMKKSTES